MTSDGEALFRAICENPADDTARLVYADWLQENGQVERADFIRLQCEAWSLCPAYPTITEARTAASRLLKEYGDLWHAELPVVPGVTWSDLFVRGFVDTAWVEAKRDVQAQLKAVFASAPVQHLTVIDFGLRGLEVLFGSEYASRLTTLRRQGRGSGFNAGVGKLIADVRKRFPNLRLI
ncbi:MAG: TIGR02996 domain-containing protein [Planctomycetia bacterium]|nr:TIGR02996 domain-containing protein [Planctomycetia bacterium]